MYLWKISIESETPGVNGLVLESLELGELIASALQFQRTDFKVRA